MAARRALPFVLLLLCLPLPAPLLPGPNLANRVEDAGAIVVARLVRGTTLASGDRVSTDLTLHLERVLKSDLIPGADISAHLEGRGYFNVPTATQSVVTGPLYGIWFLTSTRPYTVLSRDGKFAELYFVPVPLPEGAPAGKPGATPAASVANELAASLQYLAESKPDALRSLAEDFRTLDPSDTLPAYRRFAASPSLPLAAVGLAGLIAANAPEGVTGAAADWSKFTSTEVQPLINGLLAYSNPDPEAVRALATLALRDPPEPGLRENAVYALRAIHTRDALPALAALLNSPNDRIRSYALSGFCLYVRNAPVITLQSVPSMSWLQSRQPAPLLTPETQRYCLLGGMPEHPADLDAYAAFWKSWWSGQP